jgi:hypothetical protein
LDADPPAQGVKIAGRMTLRADGLLEIKNKILTIMNPEKLKKLARFESSYLHLVRTERHETEVSNRVGDLVSKE